MTGYSKKDISYAAELIHLVCEQDTETAASSKEMAEVAAWVEGAINEGQLGALTEFLSECGPAGSAPYGIARGLVRTVGSVFEVEGQHRVVFAIPFMAEARREVLLQALESRQSIERELELTKGLPFLSVRLCAHPTRRVELETLGPLGLGQIGRDLARYAASKKLKPPVLGPGAENLVWLGVYRVQGGDTSALFKVPRGTELVEWRRKCRSWLEEELAPLEMPRADVMFPMRLHDALTASRLYQLKTELNTARVALGATHLRVRRHTATLRWVLESDTKHEHIAGEMWLPDETDATVENSLRSFARTHSLELSTL